MDLQISIPRELFDEMNLIINYANSKNKLFKENKEDITINDFVIAAIREQIREINYASKNLTLSKSKGAVLKNNFKYICKENGIKQKDLSLATGIDNSTLSLILNNKLNTSLENLLLIWEALGNPPFRSCFYLEKESF